MRMRLRKVAAVASFARHGERNECTIQRCSDRLHLAIGKFRPMLRLLLLPLCVLVSLDVCVQGGAIAGKSVGGNMSQHTV